MATMTSSKLKLVKRTPTLQSASYHEDDGQHIGVYIYIYIYIGVYYFGARDFTYNDLQRRRQQDSGHTRNYCKSPIYNAIFCRKWPMRTVKAVLSRKNELWANLNTGAHKNKIIRTWQSCGRPASQCRLAASMGSKQLEYACAQAGDHRISNNAVWKCQGFSRGHWEAARLQLPCSNYCCLLLYRRSFAGWTALL